MSPGAAAIISLFVPGLGQLCLGRVFTGMFFLVMVPLGYLCFIVPGIILHMICVIHAAGG